MRALTRCDKFDCERITNPWKFDIERIMSPRKFDIERNVKTVAIRQCVDTFDNYDTLVRGTTNFLVVNLIERVNEGERWNSESIA